MAFRRHAWRRATAIAATALLLFLQLQAAVHPITHLRAPADAARATLSAPIVVDDCVECALLAGGAHAVAGALASAFVDVVPIVGTPAVPSFGGARAPLAYRSRAPPSLA